jgi:hypothetical protein
MSKWLSHVKKTMKTMKSEKKTLGKGWFKSVLKAAKSTYKKKGGEDSDEEIKVAGRRGGKTRRHRK